MKRYSQFLVCLTLLGCFAVWAVPVRSSAPDDKDKKEEPKEKKAGLDDPDVKVAIDFNYKLVQGALGNTGKVEKPAALKAHTAAWMIAAAAQSGGPARDAKLASVRDHAIKLADAIKAEKWEDARARMREIPSLKANDDAKLERVTIVDPKKLEMEDIMNQFASPRGGGLDLEETLEKWETQVPGAPEVIQMADQLAVIFEAIHSHKVEKANEQPKFDKFADAAYGKALGLAEAARKGKNADVMKAAKAMNQACADCHKDFRPKP